MRITHDYIAQKAGVSRVAVSQVLNKSRAARISPEKRQEILDISRELGYRPRNLTTHTIAYVLQVSSLKTTSEVNMLMELQVLLAQHDYRLILIELDGNDPERMRQVINAKTVDGVIFSTWSASRMQEWMTHEVPFVVAADVNLAGAVVDHVMLDFHQASCLVTQYLLKKGHRAICFATGLPGSSFHNNLKEGFYAAYEKMGISSAQTSLIEVADAREMEPLLQHEMKKQQRPTAFVGLEQVRVGNIINFLQASNYCVPRDVSVVSVFDGYDYGWLRPGITSTNASGQGIAVHVVERLLMKIERGDEQHKQLKIPSQLIERASVASLGEV